MATPAKRQKATPETECLVFYVPHRIQRDRLKFIVAGARKNGFTVTDSLGPAVTHVVTELDNQQQVWDQMKTSPAQLHPYVEVLAFSWHVQSIKFKKLAPVEGHRLPIGTISKMPDDMDAEPPLEEEYACQRATNLHHLNAKFVRPLEILQKDAEFHNTERHSSRALAFRRAACVLKSLPFQLSRLSEVQHRRHIGDSVIKVLKEVLEDGSCKAAEEIECSAWFRQMALFTQVFGVGPTTAQRWVSMGLVSINDVMNCPDIRQSEDPRLVVGLSYHSDLMLPVRRVEGNAWREFILEELQKLTPGVTVELTGGFRRGKTEGHDVDLLISHPVEGQEVGLLSRLVKRLHELDIVLYGHHEKSSYTEHVLRSDTKGAPLRSNLDHFEKWIGVVKMGRDVRDAADRDLHVTSGQCKPNSDTLSTSYRDAVAVHQSQDHAVPQSQGHRIIPQSVRRPADLAAAPCSTLSHRQGSVDTKVSRRTVGAVAGEVDSGRDWYARRVDLIVTPANQYYYALVGWTGSKHFNRSLRYYGQQELGMKLTSHGLWDHKQQRALPARSEQEVFDNLKLTYRQPTERNC